MKLREIKDISPQFDLVEHFNAAWKNDPLSEGIWNSLKTTFQKVAKTFSEVYTKANGKNGLNDVVLLGIYKEELQKLREALDQFSPEVKTKIAGMLARANIKLSGGVDISREHLNRIMVIKIVRAILFAMRQMKDSGIQWLFSTVISGGILAIISLIMDAKDYKAIGTEFVKTSGQLKALFDKANQQ